MNTYTIPASDDCHCQWMKCVCVCTPVRSFSWKGFKLTWFTYDIHRIMPPCGQRHTHTSQSSLELLTPKNRKTSIETYFQCCFSVEEDTIAAFQSLSLAPPVRYLAELCISFIFMVDTYYNLSNCPKSDYFCRIDLNAFCLCVSAEFVMSEYSGDNSPAWNWCECTEIR